jgi:hypothetical protein
MLLIDREASRTTTTTLLTDVAAEDVTFHWGTASAWRAPDNGTGVRTILHQIISFAAAS